MRSLETRQFEVAFLKQICGAMLRDFPHLES